MKKILFISVASLALIFSSCSSCSKKKAEAATDSAAAKTEQAAKSEAAAVTEGAAFTELQTKLNDILKQVEAAATKADLEVAAKAVETFRTEFASISSKLSADEQNTIKELFKNVVETAQKKEAELSKK